MCAKCGMRMTTNDVEDMCCCGVEAGQYGRILQCIPNPNIRPELPNQIVVSERKIELKKVETRPSRIVRIPDEFENYVCDDD